MVWERWGDWEHCIKDFLIRIPLQKHVYAITGNYLKIGHKLQLGKFFDSIGRTFLPVKC